jgi:tetratricopeptide (TPR) repeat protein
MPGYRQVFEQAMKRGQGFARNQAWDKAIVEFQRALAEFPDDQNALAMTVTALVSLNRLPDALTVAQHAWQVQPDDTALLEKLADLQERTNDLPAAAKSCTALGDQYLQQGHLDKAVDSWSRASRIIPEDVQLHHKLADVYQKQGQPKLAVGEWLTLSYLHRQKGELDQAARSCANALAIDPRNTDGLKLIGEIRIERGTATLPPLPEPLAPAPSTPAPALPSPVARVGPEWGDLEAEPEQVKPCPGGPVDAAAQRALADLAESIFEEIPAIQPRPDARGTAAHMTKADLDALIGQAIDLHTRGRAQQAITAYQRILDAVELPAARFNLGLFYEQELRFDQAIEQFQQCMQEPEYALGSHFALGECYRARGQADTALTHFIEALKRVDLATVKREQADDLIALYENLADTFVSQRDREQAVQFTNSLVEFLSCEGWEDKVAETRQRLDTLTDEGAPLISLAEMLRVPNVEAVLQSLALVNEYAKRNKLYAALEEGYNAIGLAPNYLPMHQRIGDLLWAGGHQEPAIAKYLTIADTYQSRAETRPAMAIYQRILNLTPMDVQTRLRLIELYVQCGEIDKALDQYMALADTCYQQAQLDKTRETYQEAMKHVPRAKDSRRWAQQILHKMGDIDMQRIDWRSAIEDFEHIKAIVPGDEKARLTLVELRFRTGEAARAIKELDELLLQYSTTGQTPKIIPVLQDQVSNRPNEMGLRMRLARAFLGAGQTAQVIEQLDALGDLQLQAGLKKDAAATIRGIIALNPPNVAQYRQVLAQISTT